MKNTYRLFHIFFIFSGIHIFSKHCVVLHDSMDSAIRRSRRFWGRRFSAQIRSPNCGGGKKCFFVKCKKSILITLRYKLPFEVFHKSIIFIIKKNNQNFGDLLITSSTFTILRLGIRPSVWYIFFIYIENSDTVKDSFLLIPLKTKVLSFSLCKYIRIGTNTEMQVGFQANAKNISPFVSLRDIKAFAIISGPPMQSVAAIIVKMNWTLAVRISSFLAWLFKACSSKTGLGLTMVWMPMKVRILVLIKIKRSLISRSRWIPEVIVNAKNRAFLA